MLRKDFVDLTNNFSQMQKIVKDQLSETGKMEKEAFDKNRAIQSLMKKKEQYEYDLANNATNTRLDLANATKKANNTNSANQSKPLELEKKSLKQQ